MDDYEDLSEIDEQELIKRNDKDNQSVNTAR